MRETREAEMGRQGESCEERFNCAFYLFSFCTRINFFNLIRAIDAHCFQAFFAISAQHFKLVIDCIVWAFKHTERNIAETGYATIASLHHSCQPSSSLFCDEVTSDSHPHTPHKSAGSTSCWTCSETSLRTPPSAMPSTRATLCPSFKTYSSC